ncbi:MAG: hypothetical protein ABI683_01020 [Ginsengibacter sp.]
MDYGLIILASSMAFIDSTTLNAVLPSIQKSLDAKVADLFWRRFRLQLAERKETR